MSTVIFVRMADGMYAVNSMEYLEELLLQGGVISHTETRTPQYHFITTLEDTGQENKEEIK